MPSGAKAEERAALFLEEKGYRILDRNFRAKVGELDIVALDKDVVVFVEVRSRAASSFGSAAETVGRLKQAKLIKTAALYAQKRRLDCPMRFDVVAIEDGVIDHIENAFE